MDDLLDGGAEQPEIRLIYGSAAAPGFSLQDLEEVLRTARSRNALTGITGVLLFEGASFLQVLEGDPVSVDTLYQQISADERHRQVALLMKEPASERLFAEWTMGYTRITLGDLKDDTGTNDFFQRGESLRSLSPSRVRDILDLFKQGSYRQRIT